MYEFRGVRGHIEVYKDGEFVLSADTMAEAHKEIEIELLNESNKEELK